MASFIYDAAIDGIVGQTIDLNADTFAVMLTDPVYSPDRSHRNRSEVLETNGFGYRSGGLIAIVSAQRDRKGTLDFSLGEVEWPNSTIRAKGAVYYKANGGQLIAFVDFGEEVASTNGTFALTASMLRFQN